MKIKFSVFALCICLLLNTVMLSACSSSDKVASESKSTRSMIPILPPSNPTSINRKGIEMPDFTKESNILTAEAAKKINENSNFGEYFLLYPFNKEEFPTLQKREYFPVMEGSAKGMFDYYPFSEGEYLLACIVITAPPCAILGIEIGDDISIVDEIMKKHGYNKEEESESYFEDKDFYRQRYRAHKVFPSGHCKFKSFFAWIFTATGHDPDAPNQWGGCSPAAL